MKQFHTLNYTGDRFLSKHGDKPLRTRHVTEARVRRFLAVHNYTSRAFLCSVSVYGMRIQRREKEETE